MLAFSYIDKGRPDEELTRLFPILYANMNAIAPTGEGYDRDLEEWLGAVRPALEKPARNIIVISDDEGLAGFFQFYVNETTFMMEEIQFIPEYQGKGVFQKLYAHLAEIVPHDIQFVEAYAHKNNTKSQSILKHLGLQTVGENKNGNSYHFRGDCKLMFKKYRKN